MKTPANERKAKRAIQELIDQATTATLADPHRAERLQRQLMSAVQHLAEVKAENASRAGSQLFLFPNHEDYRARLSESSETWLL